MTTLEDYGCSVQEVIQVMRQNPGAPLDLSAMAEIAAMSRYHFGRVFKEMTTVSPVNFLAAIRMQEAKRLLLETDLPVTTICYEVGYNSQGTFTRLFKQSVGVSPNTFRKWKQECVEGSIHKLIARHLEHPARGQSPWTVKGSIRAPERFHGVIFVGLFSSSIPNQRPLSGLLVHKPGCFDFPTSCIPQRAYLLAAGFPTNTSYSRYLLPSSDDILVGSSPCSFDSVSGVLKPDADLTLHPHTPFDVPILIALPLLLQG
jgi:AraC-like DNA-binding protein